MKELVVISGKGGTGKTSIVAAFAALAEKKVLADCDVDAADLHLILAPDVQHSEFFSGGKEATIRQVDCIDCGACLAWCRYDAVQRSNGKGNDTFLIDPFACEGCGVCVEFCPVKAIDFEPRTSGEWFISDTRHGPMVHARLGIGEENSGKLVSLVRKQASRLAVDKDLDVVIIDGPPGIACPVIASIGGTSLVLAITEPTLSGLHDLKRVVELAGHFSVPITVCINKFDINPDMTAQIEQYCEKHSLEVVGKLPYDTAVTKAQLAATSVVEENPDSVISKELRRMWDKVFSRMEQKTNE